jgi:hypothetical protein
MGVGGEGPVGGAPAPPPAPRQQPEAVEPVPANGSVDPSAPLTSLSPLGTATANYATPLPVVTSSHTAAPQTNLPVAEPLPATTVLPSGGVANPFVSGTRAAEPVVNPFGAPGAVAPAAFTPTMPYQPDATGETQALHTTPQAVADAAAGQ